MPVDPGALVGLFDDGAAWAEHSGAFYECAICDVTERVPPTTQAAVAAWMRRVLEVPLEARVQVTAQRMAPGQRVGVHTDRPWLGLEAARLVVHCTADWRPGDGGELVVCSDADGEALAVQEPRCGHGCALLLARDSWHAVRTAVRPRRSLVFHLWHPGNSARVADYVQGLLEGMRFAELPAALDPVAAEAEVRLGAEPTYRASVVAWVLHRWGCAPAEVVAGYRAALGGTPSEAAELALWVADLHREGFDEARWRSVGARVAHAPFEGALAEARAVCFGPQGGTAGW